MFNLTKDELQNAYESISHHGYSAMLPPLYEWNTFESRWDEIKSYLSAIDLDTYDPHKPLRVFAPKNRATIRVVHLLHPEDLILYTALVMIVQNDIESARISKQSRRVYSYRVNPKQSTLLYDSSGTYEAYLNQLKKKSRKKNVSFVSIADIADFYPRIYQHRLKNVIESVTKNQRGNDVARVLVDKLIFKLMDGNSYGIPVGPYASRILGEAILIDVDSHLQSKNVDYVRWVDDYNIFAESEYLAQSTLFELGEWLFANHGLTLQSSKTKILPVFRYVNEILSTPEEELTARDRMISLLRQSTGSLDYSDDDEVHEEQDIDDIVDQIQGSNLKDMLLKSLSDKELVDYEMVRYVLTRLPRIPGVSDNLKLEILDLVLDNANLLYPASEFVAKYILSFPKLTKAKKRLIGQKLLKPLKSRKNPPPDYYAMWILHIFSTSVEWNCKNDILQLYDTYKSETVRRFAALALAESGDRSTALSLKSELDQASSLVRLSIFCASGKLGKDERKHWKRAHQIQGNLEKYL